MTTDVGQDNDDMEKTHTPKEITTTFWTDPVEITTKITLGPLNKTGSKLCDLHLRRVYESQVSIKVTEDWPPVPHHSNKDFWSSHLKINLK